MQSNPRKAYEIPVQEVAGFLNGVPHDHLLAAPFESFPPELCYLVYIYRNAWAAPRFRKITEMETANAALRYHRSLRSELLPAQPDERELKKRAFIRTHQLCIRHRIIHPIFNFRVKGTVAGNAGGDEIRINFVLFRENVEETLNDTIPHELCHHWKEQLGIQGKSHGEEWKKLMRRMGVAPNRCHTMDTTNARVRPKRFHVYSCGCPQVSHVSIKRHKQMQSAQLTRPVLCLKCKQPVCYDGIDKTALRPAI